MSQASKPLLRRSSMQTTRRKRSSKAIPTTQNVPSVFFLVVIVLLLCVSRAECFFLSPQPHRPRFHQLLEKNYEEIFPPWTNMIPLAGVILPTTSCLSRTASKRVTALYSTSQKQQLLQQQQRQQLSAEAAKALQQRNLLREKIIGNNKNKNSKEQHYVFNRRTGYVEFGSAAQLTTSLPATTASSTSSSLIRKWLQNVEKVAPSVWDARKLTRLHSFTETEGPAPRGRVTTFRLELMHLNFIGTQSAPRVDVQMWSEEEEQQDDLSLPPVNGQGGQVSSRRDAARAAIARAAAKRGGGGSAAYSTTATPSSLSDSSTPNSSKCSSATSPVFKLQSVGFDANLISGTPSKSISDLQIDLVGELRPTPNGQGVVGQMGFMTTGKLPRGPLRLVPDAALRTASGVINRQIVNFAVGSFSRGAVLEFERFVREQQLEEKQKIQEET